ncbi:PB1 domain-containing protein [Artemisia annua]|uniref:PB1 domain-containing protein n=1 Tax=Artemisia annua TaxID=35608 RepID=A0A2U1M6Z6_ARTAN|nr:PB1 domain-containing protein [Artemisia annua]
MAKGKLILICQSGGHFTTSEDGTLTYNGGEANAANVTSETPFSDLKLSLAEICDLNQETVTVKYFLPGNKRNLITVKNDKDVKRMIDFHGDALTAQVFVSGTPGFVRSVPEPQANSRQSDTKNDETVNNNNVETKKDETVKKGKGGPKKERIKQSKVGAKKDKEAKKEDKVPKSPIASPTRMTRRSAAAAAKAEAASHEKEKEKSVSKSSTSNSSSDAESERVNEKVNSDCSPDYVPTRSSKRKKANSQNETDVKASPADAVKKRKRTPSWKVGANGQPTIASDSVPPKSRGKRQKTNEESSGSKKSQRKSVRSAAKGDDSTEAKSSRKRARRPRPAKADSSDQEIDEFVGPSALAIIDDDASVETVVSVWKSAISGVGQEFSNVYEFREALQRYAMANGFEYKLKKNDTNRVSGVCTGEGCSWKFNAVWVPTTESFKIKTMNNVHTCDLESRVNSLVITLNEKLQESPHLKPKEIANQLLKDSGVDLNHGTMVVRDERLGSDKESYNLLPWFCDKIIETNPGSISKLIVGENKRFKALFVSFYASLYGFQNSCRPLLFLEATSLRSMYGEVLLTANAIDGNDDFFPVAFAIVDVEDDNNWRWFLEQFKAAILYSQPMTFVFDMEKNLKTSVFEVFQDAHVGYSIYHLLESFKRNVKGPFQGDGKSFLPVYFLAAAHAVRLVGFRKSTEQIKLISSQAYDWVMQIEPQHWATSSFKGERYNHITDDVGGSLAKLMEDYQESSILQKIDALIRTMIDAITDAKLDACMWDTHLTPSKEKQLQEESLRSCGLKVLISSDTLFEVREESTHVVNIGDWSCTCLGWKETGLPCRHSLAVFALIGRNPYEYCANYFTVDAYRLTYLESINQVPIEMEEGEKFEVRKPGVEKGQALETVGENEEGGEKIQVEEENGEKIEMKNAGDENEGKTNGDNDYAEKEDCEKTEAEDKHIDIEMDEAGGEKEESMKVGGENEEAAKVENEKMEVEKDDGVKGKISETDNDPNVLVLPPIPVKPAVVKENMEWEEKEVETTKRTVTCTKCKQTGHNKKSCNFYQAQQAGELTFVN